jgi:hypothetical protein
MPASRAVWDDPNGVGAIVVAPGAEHHRAQAQRAHRQAGAAEEPVVHQASWPAGRRRISWIARRRGLLTAKAITSAMSFAVTSTWL